MRWLAVVAVVFALFLVGWTAGQKSQDENLAKKVEALEKRLAEAERKVKELERRLFNLNRQVAQLELRLSLTRKFVVEPPPFLVPHLPFEWQVPEKPGFGLPRPAPRPFVQPYYYPLEQKP